MALIALTASNTISVTASHAFCSELSFSYKNKRSQIFICVVKKSSMHVCVHVCVIPI
jgi:hypothetical protein